MALAAANGAPRIQVNDREMLSSTWRERVVEVVAAANWFLPSICGVAQEHAQQMAGASAAIDTAVLGAGVHDAQVVEKLNIALLTVEFGAEALS